MKMKHVLSAGFGAFALGLIATSAQAAPVVPLGDAVDATAADAGVVQKAHWWGHRRYYGWRHYKPYYGHYGYHGYYKPYYGRRYYKPYRWYKPYGRRYGYDRHW